jgi:hypothetical protein
VSECVILPAAHNRPSAGAGEALFLNLTRFRQYLYRLDRPLVRASRARNRHTIYMLRGAARGRFYCAKCVANDMRHHPRCSCCDCRPNAAALRAAAPRQARDCAMPFDILSSLRKSTLPVQHSILAVRMQAEHSHAKGRGPSTSSGRCPSTSSGLRHATRQRREITTPYGKTIVFRLDSALAH